MVIKRVHNLSLFWTEGQASDIAMSVERAPSIRESIGLPKKDTSGLTSYQKNVMRRTKTLIQVNEPSVKRQWQGAISAAEWNVSNGLLVGVHLCVFVAYVLFDCGSVCIFVHVLA